MSLILIITSWNDSQFCKCMLSISIGFFHSTWNDVNIEKPNMHISVMCKNEIGSMERWDRLSMVCVFVLFWMSTKTITRGDNSLRMLVTFQLLCSFDPIQSDPIRSQHLQRTIQNKCLYVYICDAFSSCQTTIKLSHRTGKLNAKSLDVCICCYKQVSVRFLYVKHHNLSNTRN